MAQLSFLDVDNRLAALSKQGDPLEAIARLVPWEDFRAEIEAVVLTADADKKSSAGRKPIDALVMFRMLVVQSLYNLSDEQAEYQARDACRSHGSWRSASKIAFPTARRCGCFARNWRRPV